MVGFITFYKAQVACLRRVPQAALPKAAGQALIIWHDLLSLRPC